MAVTHGKHLLLRHSGVRGHPGDGSWSWAGPPAAPSCPLLEPALLLVVAAVGPGLPRNSSKVSGPSSLSAAMCAAGCGTFRAPAEATLLGPSPDSGQTSYTVCLGTAGPAWVVAYHRPGTHWGKQWEVQLGAWRTEPPPVRPLCVPLTGLCGCHRPLNEAGPWVPFLPLSSGCSFHRHRELLWP